MGNSRDDNTTTPVTPEVWEASLPHLTGEWKNPYNRHRFGSKANGLMETASD